MTVETRLRTAMAATVAPTLPDTDRLVIDARRRGLGIRRRRQALATVGVVAAFGLVATAPSFVSGDGGHDRTAVASMSVGSTPVSFEAGRTAPITGRSTAAALLYAVGLESTGTATGFRGALLPYDVGVHAAAEFAFTPTGSPTAGLVNIDVQYLAANERANGEAVPRERCFDGEEECEIKDLADGSVLKTSVQRPDGHPKTGILRLATLSRTDGVFIVAESANGFGFNDSGERITRDEPVLSTAQLVAIVRQEWWGVRLPEYFTEQGDRLDPFAVPQRWLDK